MLAHPALAHSRATWDRRKKLLSDLDRGRFWPNRVPAGWLEDREHIIRENKARCKIESGNTQEYYHIALPQSSPRSLCESSRVPSSLGLSGEDSRHRASFTGLLPSSPSKHPPLPSPESEGDESLEDVVTVYGRHEIDTDGTLCALCWQVNVEVLVGGLTQYLLSEFAISSHSCRLFYVWILKITSSTMDPFDPKFRHSRVKLDVRNLVFFFGTRKQESTMLPGEYVHFDLLLYNNLRAIYELKHLFPRNLGCITSENDPPVRYGVPWHTD